MPPDLLLLVCDTARADAFSPWGGSQPSPNLERLCREGVRYDQAVAQAPWTLPSTATMFTGQLPSEHGVTAFAYRFVEGKPTSPAVAVRAFQGSWLPEALRERGYRTWAVSCNPWVSHWGGFDRGFDALTDVLPWPPLPASRVGRASRRLRQAFGPGDHGGRRAFGAFSAWLARGGSGPRFAFVNVMEMHAPYDPPLRDHPSLRMAGRASRGGPGRFALAARQLRQMGLREAPDPGYVASLRRLYDASSRYADDLIGRFVRAFAESSSELVVAVVSDHGENLGDHGLFAHHSSLHESLLRVPVVLWSKGVDVGAGASIDAPASLLGLSSWLLGWADGESPAPFVADGPIRSEYESTERHIGINAELRARRRRGGDQALPRLAHQAGLAIREGHRKYVAYEDGGEELFDLSADPGEEHDVLASFEDAALRLRPIADAWRSGLGRAASGEVGETAEEEIADHLKTLGYIE
jgi:arylsulfatase A-like enzyme